MFRFSKFSSLPYREIVFPFLLVVITSIICFLNYTPNTWLTGWDTLHPEFNFKLNFVRTIFGLWREDQALGALAAHSHMSEIPRIIFLWLASFIFPLHFLRYSYIFLCFILGPLGIYFFTKEILKTKIEDSIFTNCTAFLAGLFYIFNLGTVQHFYVVFEMFAVQYATLGWLFWSSHRFLFSQKHKNRELLIFLLISLFATPMAYASTLWFAYAGCFILFLAVHVLISKFQLLKKAFILFLVTLIVNSFWLLPNIYFLMSQNSTYVRQSQINQLFSEEAFLNNQAFGNWKDIPLLRNFLFNWVKYGDNSKFSLLMETWENHLKLPGVQPIGYIIFFLSLAGILLSITSRKKAFLAILPIWLISIFMLINENPPSGEIFHFLRKHFSLFEEGFRFPFTKFSLLYMFVFSIFTSFCFYSIFNFYKSHSNKHVAQIAYLCCTALVTSILFYYQWPLFQGEFISQKLKKPIPEEYFELFQKLQEYPISSRLALLPIHTSAGWQYQNWGYEGAGFIWFGLSQSVSVRDFDRWNPSNETFYHELATALYSEDAISVKKVLEKYQTPLILIDKSIVVPEQSDALHTEKNQETLKQAGAKLVWENSFLTLFEIPVESNKISAPSSYIEVDAETNYIRKDPITDQNNWIKNSSPHAVSYPFVQILSDRSQEIQKSTVGSDTAYLAYESAIIPESKNRQLVLPGYEPNSNFLSLAEMQLVGNSLKINFYKTTYITYGEQTLSQPTLHPITIELDKTYASIFITINSQTFEVAQNQPTIEIISLQVGENLNVNIFDHSLAKRIDLTEQFNTEEIEECWIKLDSTHFTNIEKTESKKIITTFNTATCQSLAINKSEIQNKGLAELSLSVETAKNVTPYMCLVSENNNYECLNNPFLTQSQESSNDSRLQRIALSNNDQYWIDLKSIPIDENKESLLSYGIPKINFYNQIHSEVIDKNIWQELTQPQIIQLNENSSSKSINLKYFSKKFPLSLVNTKNFSNCDLFKRGKSEKKEKGSIVEYIAENKGSACDGIVPQNFTQNSSYLLHISGENLEGRGTKLYLTNLDTNRLDLEKLISDKKYSQYFSVLSWPKETNSGYSINLETRSFGSLRSINQINDLEVFPFPIEWLSKIKLEPQKTASIENKLTVDSWKRFNPSLLQAKVSETTSPGLIVFGDSFDPGWIAFPSWKFWQTYEHVKYNGWANGWVVNNSQSQTVTIFYWPQLLEFLGFGLLFGMLVYFGVQSGKKFNEKTT